MYFVGAEPQQALELPICPGMPACRGLPEAGRQKAGELTCAFPDANLLRDPAQRRPLIGHVQLDDAGLLRVGEPLPARLAACGKSVATQFLRSGFLGLTPLVPRLDADARRRIARVALGLLGRQEARRIQDRLQADAWGGA